MDSAEISIYITLNVLANAVAAGDLGFEVTFFYVTSAIFGQNRDF